MSDTPDAFSLPERNASLGEYLEELRTLLLRCLLIIAGGSVVTFYFSTALVALLIQSLPSPSSVPPVLAIFAPQEGFLSICKLSFWTGCLGTSPLWLLLLLRFLRPGLKGAEKKLLSFFALLSTLFIAGGLFFCATCTLPIASHYLYSFNSEFGQNLWGLAAYVDFAFLLLFAHGVAFETGALLLFLIHLKVLAPEEMAKKRRHAIVAALIAGALLTPPDVPTQLMVALPLYGFYELAILYGNMRTSKGLSRERDRSCRVHPEKGAIPPRAH